MADSTNFVVGVQSNIAAFTRGVEEAIAKVRQLEQLSNSHASTFAKISSTTASSHSAAQSQVVQSVAASEASVSKLATSWKQLKDKLERESKELGLKIETLGGPSKTNIQQYTELDRAYQKTEIRLDRVIEKIKIANSLSQTSHINASATTNTARNASIFASKIKQFNGQIADDKDLIKTLRADTDPQSASIISTIEMDINKKNDAIKKLELALARQKQTLESFGAKRDVLDRAVQDIRSRRQIASASGGRKSADIDAFDFVDAGNIGVTGNFVSTRKNSVTREAEIMAALEASGRTPGSLTHGQIARIAYGRGANQLSQSQRASLSNVYASLNPGQEGGGNWAKQLAGQVPQTGSSVLDSSGMSSHLAAISENTAKAAAILSEIANKGISLAGGTGSSTKAEIDESTGQVRLKKVTATPAVDLNAASPKRLAEIEARKAAEIELLSAKEKIQINKEQRAAIRKVDEALTKEESGYSRITAFSNLRSNSINARGQSFLPENFKEIMQTPSGAQVPQAMFGQTAIQAAQREMLDQRSNDTYAALKNQSGKSSVLENTFTRAAVFGAVSVGIYKAVDAASQFFAEMVKIDQTTADLHRTLGGTSEDFKGLMDSATNISRTYKIATSDVLDALKGFSAQFKSSSDLEALTKAAALFTNLSGGKMADSVKSITDAMEQYDMSVSQASHITDAFANVSANSKVTFKELGDAFSIAGAAAKNAGVGFDQFAGMVATVSNATGRAGSDIGNKFNRIFEMSTTEAGVKALDKLGIHMTKANGDFRSFTDVIAQINGGLGKNEKKWNDLSAAQQKQIAIAFGGARQYEVFIALMNHYSDFIRSTAEATDSLGAAQSENAKITDSFSKKVQSLGVEYDKLARTTSTNVLPPLGSLLDMMIRLLKVFNEASPAAKNFGLALGGISALGLVGAFSARALFTEKNSLGQLVPRAGAGAFGESVTNFGKGAGAFGGNDSFSLVGGLGRAAINSRAGQSALGLAGIEGSSVGSFATFLTGLATAAAAIVAFTAVIESIISIMDAFKDHSKEALAASEDQAKVQRDKATDLAKITEQLKDAISSRKGLKGEDLSKFDKSTVTSILQEINSKNPTLLAKQGLGFDLRGEVVNQTTGRLQALSNALDLATKSALNNGVANSQGNSVDTSSTTFFKRMMGIEDASTPERAVALRIKDLRSNPYSGFVGGKNDVIQGLNAGENAKPQSFSQTIKALISNIRAGSIDPNNLNADAIRQKSSLFSNLSDTQLQQFSGIASSLSGRQNENQSSFDPVLASMVQKINTSKGKERAAAISNYQKSVALINKGILSSGKGAGLGELSDTRLIDALPLEKPVDLGVAGPTKDKSIRDKVGKLNNNRIDFELNKALVDNTRQSDLLGGQVDFIGGALAAKKKALVQLANDNTMAAGPGENKALIAHSEQIENLKTIKDKIESGSDKKALDAKEVSQVKTLTDKYKNLLDIKVVTRDKQLEAINEELDGEEKLKQVIQGTNDERERGEQILKKQIDLLESIQRNLTSVRDPFKQALDSILPNNENRSFTVNQLNADKDYITQEIGRARQVQTINNTVNTPQGRNEIKHLTEQYQALNLEIDNATKKTDTFHNALLGIGNSYISKVSSQFSDFVFNKVLGQGAGGKENQSMALYGESNPIVNAMAANTQALVDNTSALTGGAVSSSVGGGVTTVAGAGMSKTSAYGGYSVQDLKNAGVAIPGPGQSLSQDDLDALAINKNAMNPPGAYTGGTGGGNQKTDSMWGNVGSKVSQGILGGLAGAGVGAAITQGSNKTGYGGSAGGAIGGIAGALSVGIPVVGPLIGAVAPMLGGWIGSLFDQSVEPVKKSLDELVDPLQNLTYQLVSMNKNINTVNQTMENLINAPSNFMLPIPKGILDGSVTSQSAIATPMQAGGLIQKGGLALLHPNEVVSSAGSKSGGMGNVNISFQIDGGTANANDIANQVMTKINNSLFNQNQRSSNYSPRF